MGGDVERTPGPTGQLWKKSMSPLLRDAGRLHASREALRGGPGVAPSTTPRVRGEPNSSDPGAERASGHCSRGWAAGASAPGARRGHSTALVAARPAAAGDHHTLRPLAPPPGPRAPGLRRLRLGGVSVSLGRCALAETQTAAAAQAASGLAAP
jgi:hypothetical protein